jgi:hypothetical protein
MTTEAAVAIIKRYKIKYLFRPGRWFAKDQFYQRSIARATVDICIERLEASGEEEPTAVLWRFYDQCDKWYENRGAAQEWFVTNVMRGTVRDILELFS